MRISFAPAEVQAGGKALPKAERAADLERSIGYHFQPLGDAGGVLQVRHGGAAGVRIAGKAGATAVSLR